MSAQIDEARAAGVLHFPDGFLWGAATAAYQIEGGVGEDGRGVSIWDTFSHTPGRVRNGDTGDVAADHYHRVVEDVALMRELGLDAYRFSVAWPRVQPDGSGPPNRRGLDFYRRLVDALLVAEIEPVLTLYHWDLPQALEDAGGWSERETAYRFAEYAWEVFGAVGDSVRYWLTLNEPWCSAFMGYGMGRHAPGVHDAQREFAAAHHLLLGHGLALEALRPAATAQTQLGIVLNLETVRPASSDPADLAAARLADGMQIRFFLDPLFRGRYSPDVLEHLRAYVDLGYVHDGDLARISAPIDVLGVNYYRPSRVGARRGPAGPSWTLWPGDEHVEALPQDLPTTAMGWPVDESGLEELLARLRDEYGVPPLLVTENGAAYDDRPDADGYVRDLERIDYLDRHLRAVHRAIAAGTDVRGYFVWSLLDNFEWSEGYTWRFGLVYVDYETQRRVPKESARWYRQVIAANGLPEGAGG
jgi:beta-glucosidase